MQCHRMLPPGCLPESVTSTEEEVRALLTAVLTYMEVDWSMGFCSLGLRGPAAQSPSECACVVLDSSVRQWWIQQLVHKDDSHTLRFRLLEPCRVATAHWDLMKALRIT